LLWANPKTARRTDNVVLSSNGVVRLPLPVSRWVVLGNRDQAKSRTDDRRITMARQDLGVARVGSGMLISLGAQTYFPSSFFVFCVMIVCTNTTHCIFDKTTCVDRQFPSSLFHCLTFYHDFFNESESRTDSVRGRN